MLSVKLWWMSVTWMRLNLIVISRQKPVGKPRNENTPKICCKYKFLVARQQATGNPSVNLASSRSWIQENQNYQEFSGFWRGRISDEFPTSFGDISTSPKNQNKTHGSALLVPLDRPDRGTRLCQPILFSRSIIHSSRIN